jgi:hypothetical protein
MEKKIIKFVILILMLLLSKIELFSQLLPIPCVAYRANNVWFIADEAGNILYKSAIMLDVETYSEGFLSGYAFEGGIDNVISIYYNNSGKIELKTYSQKAFGFKNNRAFIVQDTSKDPQKPSFLFGIINKKGEYISPVKWLDIEEYSEGLAYVMNEDERGFIDTNGKFIFNLENGIAAYGFREGLSPVSNMKIDRFGYIDKTGKQVIDYNFYEAGVFSEGLARVYIPNAEDGQGGFGFINKKGDLMINNYFDETHIFQEGYNFVALQSGDTTKWGIVDKDGNIKSEFKFGDCKDFSEGIATVRDLHDTMWYYIDYNVDVVSDKYKYCGSFKNDKAFVVDKNDKKYFINKKSKTLFKLPDNADIIFDCRTNEKYGKYKK